MNYLKFAKKNSGEYLGPDLSMVNRHGLIAGATGTGKTVTVKKFVELLSNEGVPTFVVDVKGDLNSFGTAGHPDPKLQNHLAKFGEEMPEFDSFPAVYWDVFGERGLGLRATISDVGPMLLSSLMGLTRVQESAMQAIFKYSEDQGMLLLDFKDLKALTGYVYSDPSVLTAEYGTIHGKTIGVIYREVSALERQGAGEFFGEEELDLFDLLKQERGKGVVNVLYANQLSMNPTLYATFLMWLVAEMYEKFEEVGDLDRPRMVFFFDEAHLIFKNISKTLLGQLEKVVRLIRSKGIGIYFISQAPDDIPDSVLSQLGNKVQHAMRAYTAREIRRLKDASQGFRLNPDLDINKALIELGVGEALVSFLEEDGVPGITERVNILPPQSKMGMADDVDYFPDGKLNSKYKLPVDRESAYEILEERIEREAIDGKREEQEAAKHSNTTKRSPRKRRTIVEKIGTSFLNSLTRTVGSRLARGLMGTLKRK